MSWFVRATWYNPNPGLLYIAKPKASVVSQFDESDDEDDDSEDPDNFALKRNFINAMYSQGGPCFYPKAGEPLILANAHHALSSYDVRNTLQMLGLQTVAWVRIGAKARVAEMGLFDEGAQRCQQFLQQLEENQPREQNDPRKYILRNQFDVARESRVVDGEDRRVYFVGCQPVQFCSHPNPTPCRTFNLSPGLLGFDSGSIQTRDVVYGMPGVEKVTIYNGPQRHLLQACGGSLQSHGLTVGNMRRRVRELEILLRQFVENPAKLDLWTGVRVEVRVRAETAAAALDVANEYSLLDPPSALLALGQYMLSPQRRRGQTQLSELARTRFPLWWATPEVVLCHALRVLQATKQLVVGRDANKLSRSQLRAQTDIFACVGTTSARFRATSSHDIAADRNWWVVDVEQTGSVAVSDRSSEESSVESSADEEEEEEEEEDEEEEKVDLVGVPPSFSAHPCAGPQATSQAASRQRRILPSDASGKSKHLLLVACAKLVSASHPPLPQTSHLTKNVLPAKDQFVMPQPDSRTSVLCRRVWIETAAVASCWCGRAVLI